MPIAVRARNITFGAVGTYSVTHVFPHAGRSVPTTLQIMLARSALMLRGFSEAFQLTLLPSAHIGHRHRLREEARRRMIEQRRARRRHHREIGEELRGHRERLREERRHRRVQLREERRKRYEERRKLRSAYVLRRLGSSRT